MLQPSYSTEEPLSGLDGTLPIGFLAACGLLRVVTAAGQPSEIFGLSWQHQVGWTPRLHGPDGMDRDTVLRLLKGYICSRIDKPSLGRDLPKSRRHLEWGHDIHGPVDQYRESALQVRRCFRDAGREDADFFAAYGSDGIVYDRLNKFENEDKQKVEVPFVAVDPTPWHMVSGQQSMLKTVRDILHRLKRSPDAALAEALFGPWRRRDKPHSLGLDPARTAIAALCGDSPPAEDKERSTMGAVWLAFEALPLYPCAPSGGRLLCPGWDRRGKCWSWPLWEKPLTLPTIRMLLAHPVLTDEEPDPEVLACLGVSAVYRSTKVACGQDRYNLTPGLRVG